MYDHQIRGGRSSADLLKDNLLVKHYAGSLAYGTALPTSDVDFRGIFCADPINILTPFFPVRECDDQKEEDTKFYELSHFLKLCLDCNPNIVETLWVDENDIVSQTDAYDYLRNYRESFLSSKVAFTFSGYAMSQLKRIRGHNKWINNPQPSIAPQPHEYLSVVQWMGEEKNLNPDINHYYLDHRLVPYGGNIYGVFSDKDRQLWDERGSLNDVIEPGDREKYNHPIMIVKWNKEVYKETLDNWSKYWEWKNNRNEARSELEEKYGYDTKHAMHLVRLLRMGLEILKHHEVIVRRPDAEELLEIRNGSMTYEEIVKYAEYMDGLVRDVWYKATSLPKKPNIKLAAKVLMEVQEMVWQKE